MSTTAVVPKRQIGDATFSAIGYGAMGISVAYGPALPDEGRFKVGRTNHSGDFVFIYIPPGTGPRRGIRERGDPLGHCRRLPR